MNALPFGEVLPRGGEAPDLAVCAVRENNEGVVPEKVWDCVFVVSKVVVIGIVKVNIYPFEFHKDQRDSVDETDQIWTSGVHLASDRKLGCSEEIVILWIFPVNHLKHFDALTFTVWIAGGDVYAVFQEGVSHSWLQRGS